MSTDPRPACDFGDEIWRKRRDAARDCFIPWLSGLMPLEGATVLEYGCGTGAVACAFSPVVGSHVGYDISQDAIAIAHQRAAAHGADNVELHAEPADRILDAVRDRAGEPDLVLLYAVIEHMTVAERLELIQVALDVVKPGGLIAVIETPNRLVWPDWHTSFLPFLSQLPDELALAYADRSERDDFRETIASARAESHAAGLEALTRWGRGASFHEFELVLGDLLPHVVAGGFEPLLLPERPIRFEELMLGRELERQRPDLAPAFGRYWMDFVISPAPIDPAEIRFIWPWSMDTRRAQHAAWSQSECIELGPDAHVTAELPCATRRVLVTAGVGDTRAEVTVRAGGHELARGIAAEPGAHVTVDFELPDPEREVTIALDRPGHLHFVGYEAPARRPHVS